MVVVEDGKTREGLSLVSDVEKKVIGHLNAQIIICKKKIKEDNLG